VEYLVALVFGVTLAATFGLFDSTASDREPDPDPDEDPRGTEGADLLTASGAETLDGLGGDDTLSGSADSVLLGGDGRDVLIADEAAEAEGGAGDDFLRGDGNASVSGGVGDDVLMANTWADAFGGDGDDTLILTPWQVGPSGQDVQATGGAGRDLFILSNKGSLGEDHVVINDFDPASDRLALEGFGLGGSAVLQSVDTVVDTDAGHTDLLITWFSPGSVPGLITSTIRLEGVTDFDPSTLEIVTETSIAGDGYSALLGASGSFASGTPNADSLSDASSTLFQTGDGDDIVTTASSSFVAGDLGAGDDSLTATGAELRVYGGTGDDSFTLDLAPSTSVESGLLPSSRVAEYPSFDGDDGNDVVTVLNTGAGGGPIILAGGAGDDLMTDTSGSEGVVLYGGLGADTISAFTGTTAYASFDNSAADAGDRIALTIDSDALDPADLTVIGGLSGAAPGSVTVTIDPRLDGELSVVNQLGVLDSGIGQQIVFSTVFVGDTPVLIIDEPQVDLDAGFQLDDPRFVFERASAIA
jgi:serralysin